MELSEILTMYRERIQSNLYIGRAHWDALLERIQTAINITDYPDEQVWTFLLACCYSLTEEGVKSLCSQLAGGECESPKIWFEVLPTSPRQNEGSTNLDLAMGNISIRNGTESGIELDNTLEPKIIFCEFKWYSDISYKVSSSQHRNQLARVIENALYFKSSTNEYASEIHVCLVTPGQFKNRTSASRLYYYKYNDYSANIALLKADLENEVLLLSDNFPDLDSRLEILNLHWLSYEDLLANCPHSELKDALMLFAQEHGGNNF